jgi:uncharacterized protein (TIGR03086 family)
MTSISELLAATGRRAVPVVAGTQDDQLTNRTPCPEFTVADLLNHLIHVVIQFQAYAVKADADFSETPDYLTGDWRGRFAEEMDKLVAGWAQPGSEEGTAGSMDLPARSLGMMIVLDATVHAWDLAVATGQDYQPDPAVVPELAEATDQMAPMARQYGAFGEPVAAPESGSEFDSLLAVSGRDPRWS